MGMAAVGVCSLPTLFYGSVGIPFAILPLLLMGRLRRVWEDRRAVKDVLALMELPNPMPQYPVHITLSAKGRRLGTDEGIASVVDDWLHFEGARTSFSMRRSDVTARASQGSGLATAIDLDYMVDSVSFRLTMLVCGEIGGPANPYGLRPGQFVEALYAWARLESVEFGVPKFPPLYPQRRYLVETQVAFWAVLDLFVLSAGWAAWIICGTKPSNGAIFLVLPEVAIYFFMSRVWESARLLRWLDRNERLRLAEGGAPMAKRDVWPDRGLLKP